MEFWSTLISLGCPNQLHPLQGKPHPPTYLRVKWMKSHNKLQASTSHSIRSKVKRESASHHPHTLVPSPVMWQVRVLTTTPAAVCEDLQGLQRGQDQSLMRYTSWCHTDITLITVVSIDLSFTSMSSQWSLSWVAVRILTQAVLLLLLVVLTQQLERAKENVARRPVLPPGRSSCETTRLRWLTTNSYWYLQVCIIFSSQFVYLFTQQF